MNTKQPIIFGEVLFDCFPDGKEVLGGAPFNVAWHLQGFGLSPELISRVGSDKRGLEIIRAMTNWRMSTRCIQVDDQRPTGTVNVQLKNNEPSFEISPDEAYGHIEACSAVTPKDYSLFYHGSLALYNPKVSHLVEGYKKQNRIPVFIDVNLRSPWWEKKSILAMLDGASWVKLNEEELRLLSTIPPESYNNEQMAHAMLTSFGLNGLILTKGAKGATIFEKDGMRFDVTPEPGMQIIDTVGAGDGFSSVCILGLLSGWPIKKTIQRAQEFASAIVGQRGATVADRGFYTTFTKKWYPLEE